MAGRGEFYDDLKGSNAKFVEFPMLEQTVKDYEAVLDKVGLTDKPGVRLMLFDLAIRRLLNDINKKDHKYTDVSKLFGRYMKRHLSEVLEGEVNRAKKSSRELRGNRKIAATRRAMAKLRVKERLSTTYIKEQK